MQLRESRNISTKTTRLEGDPMKNLKKFAALLLAGAMALLMLTACGGGGEVGERVPEAESNLFGKYATSS